MYINNALILRIHPHRNQLPVTDTTTGIVYKNQSIFQCHTAGTGHFGITWDVVNYFNDPETLRMETLEDILSGSWR